jgi:sugar O-acyltransferase (sialic acid O-acetyltransferase NeuD family)
VSRRIIVVGAGGLAREVAWLCADIARAGGDVAFAGFVVSDVGRLGPTDDRTRVRGDLEWLRVHRDEYEGVVIGIGTPSVRRRLADEIDALLGSTPWASLVHPSAVFDRESARFGEGSVVCAGVIGTVSVVLGRHAFINLACTLGHECRVGDFAVLNPTVNVSGGVTVGAGVLVGTGAQILQYVDVGEGATVGAGAVVTRPVGPSETVVGIPARALRRSP